MDPRNIVTLPDGYNGHTRRFYADPIDSDGAQLVKLVCAERGMEYMTRWTRKSDLEKALQAREGR